MSAGSNFRPMTGTKVGTVFVGDRVGSNANGNAIFACRCDQCGYAFNQQGITLRHQQKNPNSSPCPNCRVHHATKRRLGIGESLRSKTPTLHEVRRRQRICPHCANLPHRVDGSRCSCGLFYTPEKPVDLGEIGGLVSAMGDLG